MSPATPELPPGYLQRSVADDGTIELVGPEPGPAGEASLLVAPGLFICFDAADPRIVTRVEVDDADSMDLANLLGASGQGLVDAEIGIDARLDDADAEDVRRHVARLALLLLARTVPGPLAYAAPWSFEALVLAAGVTDYGFNLSPLLAAESQGVAAAMLSELGQRGSLPADALVVRAAHVAHRALDPLDPAWFALHDAVSDLPDLSADEWQPPSGMARTTVQERGVGQSRWRGAEKLTVKSFPMVWSWVEADLRPPGEGFDKAIMAAFDVADGRIVVHCALPGRHERPFFARLVERSSSRVVSVFALLVKDGLWRGDGPLPAHADDRGLRVEVVGTLGATVLEEADLIGRIAAQWGLLALEAERASDFRTAAMRWERCAQAYGAAKLERKAAAAKAYSAACREDRIDPELHGRRAKPFESEMGRFLPEEPPS